MPAVRTAKGTTNFNGAFATNTLIASLTLASGSSLIVGLEIQDCTITSLKWNGTALTADAQVGTVGTSWGTIYALHNVTGGTGNLDLAVTGAGAGTAYGAWAIEVSGLIAAPLDQIATATGTSTSPSSGATAVTTQADEFLVGMVGTQGPVGDAAGTWGGDTSTAGQRDGSTGGSASSNSTSSEGYGTQSATGTRTASKTGITSRLWHALICTYKIAASAPIDWTQPVHQPSAHYRTTIVESGPRPGKGLN